jgi:hypothetical protein
MAALRTSIDMTVQRGCATAPDSTQHAQLLVAQPGTPIDKAIAVLAE